MSSLSALQRQLDLLKNLCRDLQSQVDRMARPAKNSWIGKAGGGDAILAITPEGGIAARTTTSVPHTFPSATCELLDEMTGDYHDPVQEKAIYNSTKIAIAGGQVIQAKRIGKLYFVDVDDC